MRIALRAVFPLHASFETGLDSSLEVRTSDVVRFREALRSRPGTSSRATVRRIVSAVQGEDSSARLTPSGGRRLAISSLVLAIVAGLILYLGTSAPPADGAALVVGLTAVVLGITSVIGRRGRSIATTAIVLGALVAVQSIVVLLAMLVFFIGLGAGSHVE